jgi:hypothetical protein
MRTFTKGELIDELRAISRQGFVRSNSGATDAAIGRTLEDLLGIEENNLPIPNASEWELKSKRIGSTALTTLVHPEPSPRALKLVPQVLLPNYGWAHQEAGQKHPVGEMSFRQTMTHGLRTDRGFTFEIDDQQRRIVVTFDSQAVHVRHQSWLTSVERRIGLGPLEPFPYWGFDDLEAIIRRKLTNAFFVEAEKKKVNGIEHFWYRRATILSSFDFDKFLSVARDGGLKVEFDARTGHNHGTKFRVFGHRLPELYKTAEVVLDV